MRDKFPRRTALKLMGTLSAAAFQGVSENTVDAHQRSTSPATKVNDTSNQSRVYDLFAMEGDRIITEEDDFGIIKWTPDHGGQLQGCWDFERIVCSTLCQLRLLA